MYPSKYAGTAFVALTMKLKVGDHWEALGIVNKRGEVEVPVGLVSCYLKY